MALARSLALGALGLGSSAILSCTQADNSAGPARRTDTQERAAGDVAARASKQGYAVVGRCCALLPPRGAQSMIEPAIDSLRQKFSWQGGSLQFAYGNVVSPDAEPPLQRTGTRSVGKTLLERFEAPTNSPTRQITWTARLPDHGPLGFENDGQTAVRITLNCTSKISCDVGIAAVNSLIFLP